VTLSELLAISAMRPTHEAFETLDANLEHFHTAFTLFKLNVHRPLLRRPHNYLCNYL